MKRRAEFELFLHKSNKPLDYIHYCENVEKAFGGMDMDEIIISHQNISKVRAKLQKIDKNDDCIDDYMVALNHYLKFAFSYTGGFKLQDLKIEAYSSFLAHFSAFPS